MSLSRFRKQPPTTNTLYDRRGDITDIRTAYKASRDDTIPLTGSSMASTSSTSSSTFSSGSRSNSFTLNPRRLSLRLKSKTRSGPPSPSSSVSSSTSSSSTSSGQSRSQHNTHTPSHTSTHPRAEFIYKPLHRQDYPTVIAETVRPASRYTYNYIPSGRSTRSSGSAGGKIGGQMSPVPGTQYQYEGQGQSQSQSQSRARTTHNERDNENGLYDDLDNGYISAGRRHSNMSIATSAAEKRRTRAARRLTTVMVPDEDEIYG
ncbi:hypothetical protein BJX99DRAFT_233678 [Aspergillus californicus]